MKCPVRLKELKEATAGDLNFSIAFHIAGGQ